MWGSIRYGPKPETCLDALAESLWSAEPFAFMDILKESIQMLRASEGNSPYPTDGLWGSDFWVYASKKPWGDPEPIFLGYLDPFEMDSYLMYSLFGNLPYEPKDPEPQIWGEFGDDPFAHEHYVGLREEDWRAYQARVDQKPPWEPPAHSVFGDRFYTPPGRQGFN